MSVFTICDKKQIKDCVLLKLQPYNLNVTIYIIFDIKLHFEILDLTRITSIAFQVSYKN